MFGLSCSSLILICFYWRWRVLCCLNCRIIYLFLLPHLFFLLQTMEYATSSSLNTKYLSGATFHWKLAADAGHYNDVSCKCTHSTGLQITYPAMSMLAKSSFMNNERWYQVGGLSCVSTFPGSVFGRWRSYCWQSVLVLIIVEKYYIDELNLGKLN